jgi:glycosyltransferase involved in cell wall biosynthesis
MAMGQGIGSKRPTEELRALGWIILEAGEVLPDHRSYREFLRTSKAEWSVAKHGYVAARTGWFSCRTACYLALGRPAVVQETGWSEYIPAGDGLLAFSTLEEAADAIADINDHYAEHQAAARALAEQFFESKKVCADLLAQAGLA